MICFYFGGDKDESREVGCKSYLCAPTRKSLYFDPKRRWAIINKSDSSILKYIKGELIPIFIMNVMSLKLSDMAGYLLYFVVYALIYKLINGRGEYLV